MTANSVEPLSSSLIGHAEEVKARERELGAYAGDGPTAEQADTFIASLCPLTELRERGFTPSELWHCYKTALDTELLWLLPERDAIGQSMKPALQELQMRIGKLLDEHVPEQSNERQTYLDLAVLSNVAKRRVKLRANRSVAFRAIDDIKVALGTTLAKFLYSFGSAMKWLGTKSRK